MADGGAALAWSCVFGGSELPSVVCVSLRVAQAYLRSKFTIPQVNKESLNFLSVATAAIAPADQRPSSRAKFFVSSKAVPVPLSVMSSAPRSGNVGAHCLGVTLCVTGDYVCRTRGF